MTRQREYLALVFGLGLVVAGCGSGGPADLSVEPDLARSSDLAKSIDLASGTADLTPESDLAALPDLAAAADLAIPADFAMAADLAMPAADLAMPVADLAMSAGDLVMIADLASKTDLTMAPADLTMMPADMTKPPADLTVLADLTKPSADLAMGGGPNTVMVGQGGLNFSPQNVTIKAGETIHWVWAASSHTVTSGANGVPDNKFCSPNDINCANASTSNVGDTYDHKFPQAGAFPYFCRPHAFAGMVGTITVQ